MASSVITHVLFRKADNWTHDDVSDWLDEHGFYPTDVETKSYQGEGSTLLSGKYTVVRVVPKSKKFARYAYSEEIKKGLWFKYGFK